MKRILLFVLLSLSLLGLSYAQQNELLSNPDFNDGTNGWWTLGADVTAGSGEINFTITNPGANSWDVQMGQSGLTLRSGYKYTLSWRAKRESGALDFRVQLDHDPYTYIFGESTNQDGSWKEETVVYENTGADVSGAGVVVQLGGSTAKATFDYISLKEELINAPVDTSLSSTEPPFHKGVGFTAAFEAKSTAEIKFNFYTRQDFINVKNLGCDAVRYYISMNNMLMDGPEMKFDPVYFNLLDKIVDIAEELDLHLILANMTNLKFDEVEYERSHLIAVWKQMAEHYKNRSTKIYYEIANEPKNNVTDEVWNQIQQEVIDAIRLIDKKHTIIVTPTNWSDFNKLSVMPHFTDTNLIYNFHFYSPFVFTNQGFPETLGPLKGVPFPYDASRMPACPQEFNGTWNETLYNNYKDEGTVEQIRKWIDTVAAFKQERNVPVWCGEFAAYMEFSPDADRVFWYETVRKLFEEKGIAWSVHDYKEGFGIFEKGSNSLFDYDLNIPLVKALGLNPPPQSAYVLKPDTTGFDIYTDYASPEINTWMPTIDGSVITPYSDDNPKEGEYCFLLDNVPIWNGIFFRFRPTKDLSFLAANNYAVDFYVKGDTPGARFQLRFTDTKTNDPNDHPWQMAKEINESNASWDGQWHHVQIPLKDFIEKGSLDGSNWYNPEGKFDWKAIDEFVISADIESLEGMKFWFDDIKIIKLAVETPVAPVLLSPANNITNANTSTTFTWKATFGAAQYGIQVADDISFNNIIKSSDAITDTAFAVTGLLEGQKYYWRVKSTNTSGSSAWSAASNFITILYAPTSLAVKRDTSAEIILTWNDNSSNEDGYLIERRINSDSSYTLLDTLKASGNTYVDKNIELALSYVYRVKAYTKFCSSGYSNEASLAGVPGVPALLEPGENILNIKTNPAFTWSRTNNSEKYNFQIADDISFNHIIKSDTALTDTSITVTGLSEGQKYYWRVQARNTGGAGPWSEISNLTTKLSAPTGLTAQKNDMNEIELTWKDNSPNEDGYVIECKMNPETSFTVIDSLKSSGKGYVDKKAEVNQTYTYRTKAYTKFAESDYSNEASLTVTGIDGEGGIPTKYSISQNYPNPFNPTTQIEFGIPYAGNVEIKLYDILGREAAMILNEHRSAGRYKVEFNAGGLTSGMYFYKIVSGNYSEIKKMILLK